MFRTLALRQSEYVEGLWVVRRLMIWGRGSCAIGGKTVM